MLIDSAVRAVKGDLTNKKGMIAAMRKADYKSTRGPYTYNVNHFPIENFYLLQGRAGPGRRHRDADPEDRLREPQGRLRRRVPDEVVVAAVAALARR